MRYLNDGEVRQLRVSERGQVGITWIPWIKGQHNAVMLSAGRYSVTIGIHFRKD